MSIPRSAPAHPTGAEPVVRNLSAAEILAVADLLASPPWPTARPLSQAMVIHLLAPDNADLLRSRPVPAREVADAAAHAGRIAWLILHPGRRPIRPGAGGDEIHRLYAALLRGDAKIRVALEEREIPEPGARPSS